MFVYVIVNRENGKIYIGKTQGSSLMRYFQQKLSEARRVKTRSKLYAAMRKYGGGAFQIYALVEGCLTNEALCAWERALIEVFRSRDSEIGYNICRGGEGFTGRHSEETRLKISETLKTKVTKEHSAKMVEARKAKRAQTGVAPKTPAERQRDYRARKSILKPSPLDSDFGLIECF